MKGRTMRVLKAILLLSVVTTVVQAEVHCPDNCVPALSNICQDVEGILSKVPVIEKHVPFVLDVVGKAICFPEDASPSDSSLCPTKCGKEGSKASELFTKVCLYVDDILQSVPTVSTTVRNLTDFAICAIADLIPIDENLDLNEGKKKKKRDSHCPSNCVPELADLCDQVEGMLENVPVVGKVPQILDIVGKAMCFPQDTKPNSGSLCPHKCGKAGDKKSIETFTKVCHYVDNILQSTPAVSAQIRNLTDRAICTIGSLIPSEKEAMLMGDASFCPENCEEELMKVCKFVEDLTDDIPGVSKVASQEIGRAICFPESATPHKNSLCPDECGDDEGQKICQYVDLLMQTPQIPENARKITTTVICKLAELFDGDIKAIKKESMTFLRSSINI